MPIGYKRRAGQYKAVHEVPSLAGCRIAKNLALSSGGVVLLGDRAGSALRGWLVLIGLVLCIALVAAPARTVRDDSNWSPEAMMGGSKIDRLSKRLWNDRGLRKARLQQSGSMTVFQQIGRAMRSMADGDDHPALETLRDAVRLARMHSHRRRR